MQNWKKLLAGTADRFPLQKLSKVLPSSLDAIGMDKPNHEESVDRQAKANVALSELEIREKVNGYKSASFIGMLRYANSLDYLLLTLGVITACTNGILPPLSTLIAKDLTDTLMGGQARYTISTLDVEEFTQRMLTHCFHFFLVGSAIFVSNFVSFSCFSTLCERQVHRIRKKFFFAVLNQVGLEGIEAGSACIPIVWL